MDALFQDIPSVVTWLWLRELAVGSCALRRSRKETAAAAMNWIESSGVGSRQMMEESSEFSWELKVRQWREDFTCAVVQWYLEWFSETVTSCVKIRCQETDSGDCNRLRTLVFAAVNYKSDEICDSAVIACSSDVQFIQLIPRLTVTTHIHVIICITYKQNVSNNVPFEIRRNQHVAENIKLIRAWICISKVLVRHDRRVYKLSFYRAPLSSMLSVPWLI
jgi:hypothetical protein